MGRENICMGSDYPFPLGEQHPGKLIESMNYTQELKDKLLFKNAQQWLGINH
jgi:aminocarboxymuconate-semialdehyde decarboxylase